MGNICEIKKKGIINRKFPRWIPDGLREILQEGEYAGYIDQVEDAARISHKSLFLLIIPVILLSLIPVLVVVTRIRALIYYGSLGLIFGSAIVIGFVITVIDKKHKEANQRVEPIIGQINQELRPRGVRWIYVTPPKTQISSGYIKVDLFNPEKEDDDDKKDLSESSTPELYSDVDNIETFTSITDDSSPYNLQNI